MTSASATQVIATAPDQLGLMNPLCPTGVTAGTPETVLSVAVRVTNLLTGCTAANQPTFNYQLPCVVSTATPTATTTPTPSPTPLPGADLSVLKTDSPDPVSSGAVVTYTITVTNNGPGTAFNVVVTDPLPNGTTFASCVPSLGTCSGPTPGTNGTVSASVGNLGPLASANITLRANVTAGAGSVISNTATASSATPDPNPANNSGTAATTVGP